ncbi:MAG: ribonuclease T2 [Pseudomonadota bacterium]
MKLLLAVAAVAVPAAAQAQALQCSVPATLPDPRPDLPSADQPSRKLPIGGYTLALTWGPQYCRTNARDAAARFQCASGNRFGFTLHGLWPDGEGRTWPQYCAAAPLIDRATVRRNLCATPSVQLLQHEWAKHGTCMGRDPARYFAAARRLYDPLRYPDMDALSRRPLTAGGLANALARANPGLRSDMMRITTGRDGWLDEVWLCFDTRLRYARCPAHQGGVAPTARVQVWRGRR